MRKNVAAALGLLLASGTVWAQQYLITTVAGGGVPFTPTAATSAALGAVGPFATDAAGSLYLAAGNCVFKVDTSGVLTRVAGSSALQGYSGDGGVATSARLNPPSGLVVDASGNVYIADAVSNVIRKVAAATGIITKAAGNGTPGYSGDGGLATSAQLSQPQGLALDAAGNLYIADEANYVVRKVAAGTGIIATFAGNGTQGLSGDGGPATSAQFFGPSRVAVDGSGSVYIRDARAYGAVRKVAAATGIITTVDAGASSGPPPYGSSPLPGGMALDGAGNLYIEDLVLGHLYSYCLIRQVAAATGIITTVYGPGYPSADMVADGPGNLYFNGIGSLVLKLPAGTGTATPVAGKSTSGYSGDGGPATSAQINVMSYGMEADGSGNLYISDSSNGVIRKVAAATGIISTVAGTGTPGFSGDGGLATSTQLAQPGSLAVDGSGNLYLSDTQRTNTADTEIRKVAAGTGVITTVAGYGGYVAVDGAANLYISDGESIVRKVAATGAVTIVAGTGTVGYSGDGGPATSAQLHYPGGLAVDGSGNLYISDGGNCRIRKVATGTGIITTVAGNGTQGYSGDGGQATSAQMNFPLGVALDGAGNLFIADAFNYAIRKVAAGTGVMTTVAGNGTQGYSGDRGPAASAQMIRPWGVAVDAAGNVYVADAVAATASGGVSVDGVVRMLAPVTHALLSVTSSHSANFARGQSEAAYSVVVSNAAAAGPSSGTVTVTEALPAGLTLVSMSGAGWNCSGAICTRNDALDPGANYPITVKVNVGLEAASQVTNQVTVSGGGSTTSSAGDLTTILGPPTAPRLLSPANGATGVLVAPTLTWDGTAESYDVYFGTQSSPPEVTSTTGTSYAPGTLNSGATYYWQIVARNGYGSTSSETRSFTTGVPAIGTRFVPVTPCRAVDTRRLGGPFGGPTMTAGWTRSFAIPQSGCGIPATAQAYSLNVTVVPEGPLSYLTLWPAGQTQPPVSTLNSWDGRVVANAAIVAAGSGGAVSVLATNQTDLIMDINGYFDASGASFYAATPCRVADTRWPTGPFGGPSLFGGQVRDLSVPLSSCAIPATASAYALNVTAVPATSYLGYLSAWPTGQASPFVSTLNSWTGTVVANAAIVPAGANGSISLLVTDPADVVLDIDGYFGPPVGAGALSFYAMTPCRVADTRVLGGPFGGPEMTAGSTRSFPIPASGCPVPSTAAAYSLNVTAVPDGRLSFLSAWPTGSPQPVVSTLNSWDGAVVANAAIVPAGADGAVNVFVTDNTHVVLDIDGYFAP